MKNGKIDINEAVEVSGKKTVKQIYEDLGFGAVPKSYSPNQSTLDIDSELKAELAGLKLAYRFINFKQFKDKGFHSAHWKPYKRKSSTKDGSRFNIDPNGYTTYQDLVLAVKPVEWNDAHKQYLRQKAKKQSNPAKLKADEFKEHVKDQGISTKVDDTFEDET